MNIDLWDVSRPKPYGGNPRKLPEKAIKKVAASIKEFGFRSPIVVDEQEVILAGHTRLDAAKSLGLKKVPVHIATGLTEAQRRAYRIADNRVAQETDWLEDALKLELDALDELGFDLDLTGFDVPELNRLMQDDEEEERAEETPEPPANPVSITGDVWLLGKHRLLCGDSTSIDAMNHLMAGEKAEFCFTSPPYNAAITSAPMHSKAPKAGSGGLYVGGFADNRSGEEYIQFNLDIISALACVADGNFTCCYNINYNKNSPSEYIDIVAAAKRSIPLVETIVWEKAMAVSLQGDNLTRIYEFIFVFCKGKFRINKNRTECLRNLWKISNIGANHESHKACFPVALVEEGVRSFCPHGGNIIEPFCGTGTTVIAAERLGCRAFAMELDPKYCDVTAERWQNFTGQEATNEETGKTFKEMKDARHGQSKGSEENRNATGKAKKQGRKTAKTAA